MVNFTVSSKSINNIPYIHIRFPSIRLWFEFIRIYLLILEDVYASSDVDIYWIFKPGSHEGHKHKQRKQSITSPLGLTKTKQQEFFFVSPFVLLLAYAWTMILCLWRSLCRSLDFIPLFFLYAYAYAIVWSICFTSELAYTSSNINNNTH